MLGLLSVQAGQDVVEFAEGLVRPLDRPFGVIHNVTLSRRDHSQFPAASSNN